MDLSSRLENIVTILPKSNKIVDIGTDHGYVLIELIKNNKIKYGIASDNKKGPLERAIKNSELYSVKNRMDFRLGSGLATIKTNEVNGAIFAGMGSNLIRELIESDMEKIKTMDYILIQPAQKIEVIREYIYNGPFKVLYEDILKEDSRFYQYILFKYDSSINSINKTNSYNYKLALKYPKERKNIVLDYLNFEIKNAEKILDKITIINNNTKEKKEKIYNEIENYKELRNDFKS